MEDKMNRLVMFMACLGAGVVLSATMQAQTSLNVTAGSFTEITGTFGINDITTFSISAVDPTTGTTYAFTGDSGCPAAGFASCNFGCSRASIQQIGKSVPLQIVPPGSLWGIPSSNGTVPLYCWITGGGQFTYSSGFSSAINGGILTVKGVVTPGMEFEPGTPDGSGDCLSVGLPTFVISGKWQYAAQFQQIVGSVGWYLIQDVITPVP
jgi:hypothetical protein